MGTDFLTLTDLVAIADGVIPGYRVRDLGLLESAVMRPQTTVFGDLAYPTIPAQAAALLHSLVRNHALIDGNNTLAWSAMRVFLELNGFTLTYSVDDAETFVLTAARGEYDIARIAEWITGHMRPMD